MRPSNFTNPLVLFQTISIYSYFNSLGDFLHEEGILTGNNKYEPISTVNGLCHYLEGNNHIQEKKLQLTRQLLRGSNLYSENGNEIPDVHSIDTLFDYIISYPLFTKYTNKYGFIAEIIRSSNDSSLANIFHRTKIHLNAELKNGFGPDITLNSCSRERIFKGLIEPLFPNPGGDLELFSVDYIYAQAGYSFLRSGRINSGYFPRENFPTAEKERPDEVIFAEKSFDEQIVVGLAIEHLVTSGQLDASALRIFALPAFLYYVHEKKQDLWTKRTENIITDPYHWAEAYRLLFSNLNRAFEKLEVKKAKKATIFRESIQKTLKMLKNVSKTRTIDFSKLVKDYMLDDSKIDVTRLIDPGFELASDVGEGGLRSIEKLLETIEKQFSIPFNATKQILKKSRRVLTNPSKEIGPEFGADVPKSPEEQPLRQLSRKKRSDKIDVNLLKNCRRSQALNRKKEIEYKFIKSAEIKLVMNEKEIINVLRSYIFPEDGRKREKFMADWLKYGTVPAWGKEYKIDEPEIFHDLMYLPTFKPERELVRRKAEKLIEKLYVVEADIHQIEDGTNQLENLLQLYYGNKHYLEVKFEDYFAIRNYGRTGYLRINQDSREANRMKMALYRLSIRQSDEPLELFPSSLSRGDRTNRERIEEFFNSKSSGKNFKFGRFTSASKLERVARSYFGEVGEDSTHSSLMLILKFPEGRYPRARIEEMAAYKNEKESIILPDTEFRIKEIKMENAETLEDLGRTSIVTVVMEAIIPTRDEWQRSIMKKIHELKKTGTKFFKEDLNKVELCSIM